MRWLLGLLTVQCLLHPALNIVYRPQHYSRITKISRLFTRPPQSNSTVISTTSTEKTSTDKASTVHSFRQPARARQHVARQTLLTSRIRAQNRAAKAHRTQEKVRKVQKEFRSRILTSRRREPPTNIKTKHEKITTKPPPVRTISNALLKLFSQRNKGRGAVLLS